MIYYVDGYCLLRNPSPTGGGYSVFNNKNKLVTEVKINKNGITSNELELLGVNYVSKLAKKNDVIVTDSQNTIYWVWAGKCGARPDLSQIARETKELILRKNLFLAWLPREFNLAGHYNEQFERDNLYKK